MNLKFVHPSTILVSGPTGCGKTRFVSKMILKNMFDRMPRRIIWVYSEWQSLYDEVKLLRSEIEFQHGLSDQLYDSLDANIRNLVILDDQLSHAGDSKMLSRLFTEGSHHRNLSIIYIVQNLFDKGKSHRTVSLNAQYIVLFKNPRDKSQIVTLGRQMFPRDVAFLSDSFEDATTEPYGYLLIDLRPETPEEFRLRTSIFQGEESIAYIPVSRHKNG